MANALISQPKTAVFEPPEFVERLAAMTLRLEPNLRICHGALRMSPASKPPPTRIQRAPSFSAPPRPSACG